MKFCTAFLAISTVPALLAQNSAPPQAPAPAVAPVAAAAPVDKDKVVLTVGSEKITVAQYEQLVSGLQPQYQTYARGAGKRQFVEQLVQVKLLAQEAQKRKLDQAK